jgi:hypothetical protein
MKRSLTRFITRSFCIGLAGLLCSPTYAADPEGMPDLSDPEQLLDAYIRTVGDTSGKEVLLYASVVVIGMHPGEKGQKLFGLEVLGASRFLPIEDGYQRLHREVGLYTDLQTGEVLASWDNPWSGESVEVIHIQNDPVNFPFTVETQRGPYRVKFDDLGHTIGFHRQIPLRYPNPLPKSDYPQYSANDWYEAAELFNSFVTKVDLADRSKTSLPEVGTWSRTGPWLPWMEMADRPGYLLYHGRSVKLMNGLDDLRPELRAHIETHYPTYTGAPDTFESPNDTSWTYFKKVLDARAAAEGES